MDIFKRCTPCTRAVFFSLFLFVIASIGVFGFAQGVYAAPDNEIVKALMTGFGGLVSLIINLVGHMVAMVLYVLLAVAQYNDFIYSTAVTKGWSIVRDICNMFFVLVLLAIAAGTILQQEKYHYSKTLPKLILMAILINFSRTICGLLIDFAQVVMMTFVGAFSGTGPGNFMALLGIQNLLKMTAGGGSTDSSVFISLLLAVVYVFIALIVLMVITVQFIIRIVALWFLVAISPFAFFLSALPQGEKYASKWWEQFTNYVILGPVLAFFLWISLAVTQHAADGKTDASDVQIHRELGKKDGKEYWPDAKTDKNAEGFAVGNSIAGTVPGTAGFILGIVMLLASLIAAQQLAGVGAGMAAGAMTGMKNVASGTAKAPFQFAGSTAKAGAGAAAGAAKKVGSGAVNLARNAYADYAEKSREKREAKERSGSGGSSGAARVSLAKGGAAVGQGVGKAGSAVGEGVTRGGAAASSAMMRAGMATGPAAVVTTPLAALGAGVVRATTALGGGVIKAGSAVAGGTIRAVATLAKTDTKALGGIMKKGATNKIQAGLESARSLRKKAQDFDPGEALDAVGRAGGKGLKKVGGFLKEDAKKTFGHAQAGVGAIGKGAQAVGTTVGAGLKKAGEINKATDIGVLAGKVGEAVKDTKEYKEAKGLHEIFGEKKTETQTDTSSEQKKEEQTQKPPVASIPSEPVQDQPKRISSTPEIAKLENDLKWEQEDQRRIQKGRKQAESALLHLDENAEGSQVRKVALGVVAKDLTDQEEAKSHVIEDLKVRIQEAKEKKSDEAKFGAQEKSPETKPPAQEEDQKRPDREAENKESERRQMIVNKEEEMNIQNIMHTEALAIQDPKERTNVTQEIDQKRAGIAKELEQLSAQDSGASEPASPARGGGIGAEKMNIGGLAVGNVIGASQQIQSNVNVQQTQVRGEGGAIDADVKDALNRIESKQKKTIRMLEDSKPTAKEGRNTPPPSPPPVAV